MSNSNTKRRKLKKYERKILGWLPSREQCDTLVREAWKTGRWDQAVVDECKSFTEGDFSAIEKRLAAYLHASHNPDIVHHGNRSGGKTWEQVRTAQEKGVQLPRELQFFMSSGSAGFLEPGYNERRFYVILPKGGDT